MGILWGQRGDTLAQYNFSTVNYANDLTVPFSVSPGIVSVNQLSTSDSLERLGTVNLSFNYDASTIPDELELQYRVEGTPGWFKLDDLFFNDGQTVKTYSFLNDKFYDLNNRVKFRLTYQTGNGHGYNLASTSWLSVKYNKLTISNKVRLEEAIFNNDDIITVEFSDKINFNRSENKIEVYSSYDNNSLLGKFEGYVNVQDLSYNFTPDPDFSGDIQLKFVTLWGDDLDSVVVSVKDKYISLGHLLPRYNVDAPITITWSNSTNFNNEKITVLYTDDGGASFGILTDTWNVNDEPFTTSFSTPQTIQFLVKTSDEWSTVSSELSIPIVIGEPCKEDSLRIVVEDLEIWIDELLVDNLAKDSEIDSLEAIIRGYEPEYIFITLIKDYLTNVEVDYEVNTNDMITLTVTNDVITISKDVELFSGFNYTYITDLNGNIIYEKQAYSDSYGDLQINVGSYSNSLYIVYIISEDNQIKSFKFIKQ